MAKRKDFGGPAFPQPITDCEATQGPLTTLERDNAQSGMTLRDWFAGQALSGFSGEIEDLERAADWCYEMADAMLKAR